MEISEICRGNKILISLPNSKLRIPNLEVEVQGISIFGEIECLHTPQKEGYTIDVRHCSGVEIKDKYLTDLGFVKTELDDQIIFKNDKNIALIFRFGTFGFYKEGTFISLIEYVHEFQNLLKFIKW